MRRDDTVKVYRTWDHVYTPETITAVLERAGLGVEGLWGDLEGTPYHEGAPALGIVAGLMAPERG